MSLCNVCGSIPWRKFVKGERYEQTVGMDGFRFNAAGRTSSATSNDFPWNERRCTIAEIASRAKTCSLCAFILLMIKRKTWELLLKRGTLFTWERVKSYIPRNVMVWMTLPTYWRAQPRIEVCLGSPKRRETLELNLQLRLSPESPMWHNRIPYVLFRETLYPRSLQRMVSWLDTCNASHPGCSHLSTRLVPLPTRVLDVSMLPEREQMLGDHQAWSNCFKDRSCKVIQTPTATMGRYAALSYCWGSMLPLTTTTTNLKSHESGISFDKLPRTLQDAVMIVRYLGIEYIWVDCLCILQDSKGDWEHEAANMSDVYSNAYLTIAAARARHCEDGFLGPRDMEPPLRIDVEDEEGFLELYIENYDKVRRLQPLHSRAWATQEDLLSHRVLSFDNRHIKWRCSHLDENENEFPMYCQSRPGKILELMAEALKEPLLKGLMPNRPGFADTIWARFTVDFSRREVTHETDIFPAMAGIVKGIQKITRDTFYAGLWKLRFFDGLVWHSEPRSHEIIPSKRFGKKPQTLTKRLTWVAPSWSWASVKGTIAYGYSTKPGECCARLEECTITRSGSDPLSAPTAGFIRITGPVTLITNVQAEDELEFLFPWCSLQLRNGTRVTANVMYDIVHRESCSVLMITTQIGLVIEKAEQTTDTYIRVGTVQVRKRFEKHDGPSGRMELPPLTAADHFPPRTITLV